MRYTPHIPLIPAIWQEKWAPGNGSKPDIWSASKKLWSGIVIHEVEFSDAAISPGTPAHGPFRNAIDFVTPAGYTLIEDWHRPLPTEWFPMHACVRRYALYPTNRPDLAVEATRQAQVQYDTKKWNRGRLAYGPCNLPFPLLTSNQIQQETLKVSWWLTGIRNMLETGTSGGIEDSQDGLFENVGGWRPWGIMERYAHGGSGIFFYTGWEQTQNTPAYSWLVACCAHERRWHAYNRATGEPINVYDYPDPGPMYQEGSQTANNRWLPEFASVAQWPDPLYLPYDTAHAIRGFRHALALSEMIDSPAVKRMIRSQAAQFRLQRSDRGPYPSSGYTPPSLRTDLASVVGRPHTGYYGADVGRQLGWPAYVIAQSIKLGARENKPWARMFSEFAEVAAMPNGIVPRNITTNPADIWYDLRNDTAQAFEVPIFWHGAVGCSIYSGGHRFESQLSDFGHSLYVDAPLYPYYSGHGPPHFPFVAEKGGQPYATVTNGKVSSGGDSTHVHAGAALVSHVMPSLRSQMLARAQYINPIHDLRESAGLIAQIQRS